MAPIGRLWYRTPHFSAHSSVRFHPALVALGPLCIHLCPSKELQTEFCARFRRERKREEPVVGCVSSFFLEAYTDARKSCAVVVVGRAGRRCGVGFVYEDAGVLWRETRARERNGRTHRNAHHSAYNLIKIVLLPFWPRLLPRRRRKPPFQKFGSRKPLRASPRRWWEAVLSSCRRSVGVLRLC